MGAAKACEDQSLNVGDMNRQEMLTDMLTGCSAHETGCHTYVFAVPSHLWHIAVSGSAIRLASDGRHSSEVGSESCPRYRTKVRLRFCSHQHGVTECTRYRITALFLVPSMIHQLVNDRDFARAEFSSVTAVHSGAARLPPGLAEQFETFVKNSSPVYSGG